jgi:hypothetical protein
MSMFFDRWERCMRTHGFPVPTMETLNEALEFVHQLHGAIEASGDAEVTIAGLLAAGALLGVDEAALAALGEVAEAAAAGYLAACVGCLGSTALEDLRQLFASGELDDFVVAELGERGVELSGDAVA